MNFSFCVQKHQPLVKKRVLLHSYDNASHHKTNMSRVVIKTMRREVLTHPLYSQDVASSNYYLFLDTDNNLRKERFRNTNEVTVTAVQFLDFQK